MVAKSSVKAEKSVDIVVPAIQKGMARFCLLGTTPIFLNRLSEKARRELLFPRKKTVSDREFTLKHDPDAEFRASPYIDHDANGPTFIQHPCAAFKRAMSESALDIPGTNKSQVGRLLWVCGEYTSIFGMPYLDMRPVRNSDVNRTPDIRTRVIIPRWACEITVSWIEPLLNRTSVSNLLVWAGIAQGVGDYRNGKGAGTYGTFESVPEDNPDYKQILKVGRKQQQAAMDNPDFYNAESEELYKWFQEEVKKRGKESQQQDRKGRTSTAISAPTEPGNGGDRLRIGTADTHRRRRAGHCLAGLGSGSGRHDTADMDWSGGDRHGRTRWRESGLARRSRCVRTRRGMAGRGSAGVAE